MIQSFFSTKSAKLVITMGKKKVQESYFLAKFLFLSYSSSSSQDWDCSFAIFYRHHLATCCKEAC